MRGELWIPCSLLLLSSLPFLLAIEDPLIAADKNGGKVEHRVKRNSESHSKTPLYSDSEEYPGSYPGFPGFPGSYPGFPGSYPGFPGSFPGFPGSYPGYPGSPYGYPGAIPGGVPIVIPVPYIPPGGNPHEPCDCTPKPLPPCTKKNKPPHKTPAEGGPLCECNHDFHPQGCTPKLCEAGILPKLLPLYVCICLGVNPHNEPPNCIKLLNVGPVGAPSTTAQGASTSGEGQTSVLGLAELSGIKSNAKDQLGAGIGGANLLSDEKNSKLHVNLLDNVVGGKTSADGSPLKSAADSLLGLLGGGSKSGSALSGLGLKKRKKRAAWKGNQPLNSTAVES